MSKRLPFGICVGIIAIALLAEPVSAQRKVKLQHADRTKGRIVNGERIDRMIGNVVFVQNQTTIYCDSAIFYRSQNAMDAFGRVRIVDGDSVTITASLLKYNGNTKIANLRRNVVFTKLNTTTLYTDYLDYDRVKNQARYFNGGKLVDSTNTLTSAKGYYDIPRNLASFKKDVVGVNQDYTLTSDTLQYNSRTKTLLFQDVTTIIDSKGDKAIYREGFYDTRSKTSDLKKGQFETPSYRVTGDKYLIDDLRKVYKARTNVVMVAKEDQLNIYGDFGDYDKGAGISKVWGNAYLAKITEEQDTLFLAADTLISIESPDPAKKRLLAYPNVRVFRSDLQGIADSLVYVAADSMMYFYGDPVLWSNGNQMTADSIRMLILKKKIDKVYMINNSFVISQDSLGNFNQIKGRKMVANFRQDAIDHVNVTGNGESLYFALQEEEIKSDTVAVGKILFVTGLNKIICSNMKINFKRGTVNNVTFYVKPDAEFIPPHEIKEADTRLKNFTWRINDRPRKRDVTGK